ncbi:GDSL family lipase [Prauserella marina]|uniref:GDSL-like Lipase/Acylhydrolase family protein n=1 Tax=Prauserella marina TaxID=530584 RepID=A0A222VJK1_9PSEU|nr:SGNH/GDSL hydrolase family protein [Prauserella marina]ASR34054.1 GDSL family lipase [Prauserella marina]PWV82690.1 GDSL-like lipase/acylhydrolase family protein [Prauserella marina]SDC74830.1 GDSL-like Lipase/Acylhydrolase family protein [Prauserella marina]
MRRRHGLVLIGVLITVTACGTQETERQTGQQAPEAAAPTSPGTSAVRYVALGDSYTSAPGAGKAVGSPAGCGRTEVNYPRLVAESLRATEFTDASCGGATTADLTRPQRTPEGTNPAQIDAVTPETTLVTIGIAGNDVGLVAAAATCTTTDPNATPCRDQLGDRGTTRFDAAIADAADRVGSVLGKVAEKAPKARVVLVGYPAVVPDDGNACWPELPYSPSDVEFLRQGLDQLNGQLSDKAREHGAEFAETTSFTEGHGMCAPAEQRWIEGPRSSTETAPLHPNARGEKAMAEAVLHVIGQV